MTRHISMTVECLLVDFAVCKCVHVLRKLPWCVRIGVFAVIMKRI